MAPGAAGDAGPAAAGSWAGPAAAAAAAAGSRAREAPPGSAGGRAPSPLRTRPASRGGGGGGDVEQRAWHGPGLPTLRGRRVGSMEGLSRLDGGQLDPQHALLLGSPHPAASGGKDGGGGDFPAPDSPAEHEAPAATWRACLMREPLLLLTLAGVLAGVLLGAALRPAGLSPQAISLVGFPGELMLRLLKMLVLPLVCVSMVAGVCALRQQDGGGGGGGVRRLARLTAAFYLGSTLLAIVVGIALVVAVRPGRGAPFDRIASAGGGCHTARAQEVKAAGAQAPRVTTTEALLNVARQVVPENVVAAAVDMNVLGLITFSLMFGLALSSLGPAADPGIQAVGVLNAAVQRMVTAALWASPLGVGSLVAASILRACDLWGTLAALGLWVVTVLAGLALFAAALLPLLLWGATRRSPLAVARQFAQALIMAFGTSSSAAALPLAMQAAKQGGCEAAVVDFFLPLGTTVNLCGTALYESTTAIFIAQAHGVHLGAAELLVIALTASLAAVGAPAIPSAGLVTMMIVLQAVGLAQYASDLAVILAVDWLLDRVRTAVNLLGDAFGCVIVDHLLQGRPPGGSGGGKPIPVYIQLEMGEAPAPR